MLVAGCVAGLITMSLHPVLSHHGGLPSPQAMERLARLDRAVHGLALAGIVMIFLGALALTRQLAAGSRLAVAALVLYGFAAAAITVAGTMDGFVAADLLVKMVAGDPKLELWWMLLGYNTRLVVAFASVYTVGACAAIFLWSLAMVRTRQMAAGLGWYGLVLGPVIVLALFVGHLSLDVHGMGLVALLQSIWFILAGVALMQSVDAENSAPHDPPRTSPATGSGQAGSLFHDPDLGDGLVGR